METPTAARIDKWLWSVRLFKTRSLASRACAAGQVQVNGHPAKPARCVRPGDMILAVTGEVARTVKVIAVLERRVGASLVARYLEDMTPAAEYEKARLKAAAAVHLDHRPKGAGRPTKRDRRILQSFFGHEE